MTLEKYLPSLGRGLEAPDVVDKDSDWDPSYCSSCEGCIAEIEYCILNADTREVLGNGWRLLRPRRNLGIIT